MRHAALVALLAATAVPAVAQDARIRSGEHATFSRLVVYLPESSSYEVEAGDGTFAVHFGGDFAFDTSEVFYYIPRTRIAELSAGSGRLQLDLGCDCVVTVERLSDTALFLDVNDPGTVVALQPETEPAEASDEQDIGSARAWPAPAIQLPIAVDVAATLLPGGLGLGQEEIFATKETAPDRAPIEQAKAPEARDQAVSATTHAVAEQIARAAAQGLLEAEPVDVPAIRPERRPDQVPRDSVERTSPAVTPDVEAEGTKRHVSIRTSIDEALDRRVSTALSDLGMSGPCLPDETFDAAAWLPGEQGLARLRSQAIGEFDRPDPEGVTNLARAYVAMSFGAEARHAIQAFRVGVPDADVLLVMSDIVDEGSARDPGRLTTQYDCPGAGALWAALSSPEIPDAAELDTNALALAFSALPPHLRTQLGPMLAERLLDYGAVETAGVVRTAIIRAPGAPTVELALLDASIALEFEREEEADAKLAEVVEETSGRSVGAVERLIERRLEAGEPVEEEVLAAADALIYEHRGTPLAYRLSELRIEGLAKSGKVRRALSFLAETERHLPRETADRLRGVVYAEAARLPDDAEFLLVAVKAPPELGNSPEEMAARRALARRLGEMELYALADSLGVEDGRSVAAQGRATAPRSPSFREPLPVETATLERTAALLQHSAALRQRLASAISEPGAEGR